MIKKFNLDVIEICLSILKNIAWIIVLFWFMYILLTVGDAKADTTLNTLQNNIDIVELHKPQNRDGWSKQQREVAEIVDRINKIQPSKKPRTDLIRDFGRNGIDIIQEYR